MVDSIVVILDNVTLRLETVMVKFGNTITEIPSAFAKYFPKA